MPTSTQHVDAEAIWDGRFRDPDRHAASVAALPEGPVRTYLQGRIAWVEGRLDDCLRLCAAAEEAMTGRDVWRARLLETRGNVLNELGLDEDAQLMLTAAWEIYHELGDAVGLAGVRQNIATLRFQPAETARQLYAEALELAEPTGRDDLIGIILLNVVESQQDAAGGLEERLALAERAHGLLHESWPLMAVRARTVQVALALDAGRIDRARDLVATLPRPGDVANASLRWALADRWAKVALADGRPEDAVEVLQEALALTLRVEDRPDLGRLISRALAECGRGAEALVAAQRAYDELLELKHADDTSRARALDVWHRTSMLRRERAEEAARADSLARANAELRIATRRIHELSVRDPLTRLHNRQYLTDHADALLGSPGDGGVAELALIDLDRFKRINDTYGHSAGDAVLREFSRLLVDHLPATDLAVRQGGEEFVVLRRARRADDGRGRRLAQDLDELRAVMRESDWSDDGRRLPPVTMSAGVTVAHGGSLDRALSRADALMYRAKREGRDRIISDAP